MKKGKFVELNEDKHAFKKCVEKLPVDPKDLSAEKEKFVVIKLLIPKGTKVYLSEGEEKGKCRAEKAVIVDDPELKNRCFFSYFEV